MQWRADAAGGVVALMVLAAGCGNHVNFLPRYERVVFPPSAEAEVLFEPPSRTYVEIGLVTVESDDWSEEKMLRKLRARAKKAGADAVVIRAMGLRGGEDVSAVGVGAGSGQWRSLLVTTHRENVRRMEGLAIRYTERK